jgi:tetratricopeptide (TPR) repeat protein
MERGETAKAENILERIVKLDAAFAPEHKHLFNEFGIKLRKNKMIKDALTYYTRALELSKQDENLYYNIARAHLENKDPALALDFLLKSLELNPGFAEASQFLLWLYNKKLVPEAKKTEVATALKKIKEATQAGSAAPAAEAAPPAAGAAGVASGGVSGGVSGTTAGAASGSAKG